MLSSIKIESIENYADFAGMRKAGRLAAEILDAVNEIIKPGVPTIEIDKFCHDMIIANGATPACLGYRGYEHTVCTSVNHVVCHGIPSDKKLNDGDIVNIDVTVIVDGYYGDTSRMYYVGDKVSLKAKRLVETTHDSLMAAIKCVAPGVPFNEIGRAIEAVVKPFNYGVVSDFCGHGIGKEFHLAPQVLHYYEPSFTDIMQEGMFFTIEPMINIGKPQTKTLADGWTAVTRDRSLSAQFEHTMGVTKDGVEIFTLSPKDIYMPK